MLKRLSRIEKELLELRIQAGRVPDDRHDQRLLTLLETPYLGMVQFGAVNGQRFFAARLLAVNLTDRAAVLKRDDVQLVADGQTFAVKDPPRQLRSVPLQLGQQPVQPRNLRMPETVTVPAGGTASTWMIFPELPPGSHVPQLVLKLQLAESPHEIDVNATQRDALDFVVERIGPRGSLGLVTIRGTLNTINVGALVAEVDRLALDKLVRVVIRFAEGSSIADPQLIRWLQYAVVHLDGAPQQRFVESQFPSLPASLHELHLAALPAGNESRGLQMPYPAPDFPNPGRGAGARIHNTDAEAIVAALQTAYEVLPRDELLQTIQSASRLERAAALAAGGGRLAVEHLPLLLRLADDDDTIVQQGALVALSHFGESAAIEKLAAWAAKNQPPLSTTAIGSLALSRYPAAHEALLKLLANEPPEGKKAIVRILAAVPRPIWSEALYEFVADARSGLNIDALNALVQVGHPKLLQVLKDALHGGDAALAQSALAVLVARTDRDSEDLALEYTLSLLKSAPPTPTMLQLLNRVKDERAIPLLLSQFDRQPNNTALIQTLALLGDTETARVLASKYPNLQGQERAEALQAIQQLDKPRFRALAAQALQAGDTAVASHAVKGLQEDGSADAVQVLIEALESSTSAFTWSHVANALSQIATTPARQALFRACDTGNAEKRNYAVGALQMMRTRSPGYQYVVEAQGFLQKKSWKEALEKFDIAIQLDPQLSDAYAERGHCLLQSDKPAAAAKDFAKAWELDPYNSLALTGICIVKVMVEGKHAEAAARLEESRSKFLRQPIFHYNAACVYGRAYELVHNDGQVPDREALLARYRQSAVADLKASIEAGFQDFSHIQEDPDLKSLHGVPEFDELLKRQPPAADADGTAPARGRGRS